MANNFSANQKTMAIAAIIAATALAFVFSQAKENSSSDNSAAAAAAASPKKLQEPEGPEEPEEPEELPQKIEGGKEEGLTEEIAAIVSRICKLYAKQDKRSRDSIKADAIRALCRESRAAMHIFNTIWDLGDKDDLDRVTCNELVHYFLRVKSHFGVNVLRSHLAVLETAADADKVPANVTAQRGSGDGYTSEEEVDEQTRQDLPSSWLPIITSRIISIFRRIDMNGDHGIDKEEILKLHGGDKHTTESMFADLDTNHDGSISPQEFVEYFFRVLKRCEEKDRKELIRNSPLRVNSLGNLERDLSAIPSPSKPLGASLTKGRKMVNKIASILEHKLTERDERLQY